MGCLCPMKCTFMRLSRFSKLLHEVQYWHMPLRFAFEGKKCLLCRCCIYIRSTWLASSKTNHSVLCFFSDFVAISSTPIALKSREINEGCKGTDYRLYQQNLISTIQNVSARQETSYPPLPELASKQIAAFSKKIFIHS